MSDTEFKKQLDKWLKSDEGRDCHKGIAAGEYLKNRLYRAFAAGYNAASERLRKLIKECELKS